jgi:hypothetical protein
VNHIVHRKKGEATEIQIDTSFELIYSVPQDANPTPEELDAEDVRIAHKTGDGQPFILPWLSSPDTIAEGRRHYRTMLHA